MFDILLNFVIMSGQRRRRSESGRVADMLGRKRIYGFEVLILRGRGDRVGVRAELHVPAHLPDHCRRRHFGEFAGAGGYRGPRLQESQVSAV